MNNNLIHDFEKFNSKHKEVCKGFLSKYLEENPNAFMRIRLATVLCTLLVFAIGVPRCSKESFSTMEEGECFRDYTFHLTESANKFLDKNREFTSALMIISGLGMDLCTVYGTVYLALHDHSMRIFTIFALFFVMRGQV